MDMHLDKSTLLIRNIPPNLQEYQVQDLLMNFRAESVRYMGKTGYMKHSAFARFSSPQLASNALMQLHQLSVLNYVLKAEYSKAGGTINFGKAKELANHSANKRFCTRADQLELGTLTTDRTQNSIPGGSQVSKVVLDSSINRNNCYANTGENEHNVGSTRERQSNINYLSMSWDIPYTIDERLIYRYPMPTETTLHNILHCMASVPKFYNQVLNLMNKMNLPPPFGELTTAPPVKKDNSPTSYREGLTSSEESEMESSDDDPSELTKKKRQDSISAKKRVRKLPTEIYAKRLRSQLNLVNPSVSHQTASSDAATVSDARPTSVQDVFEVAREQAKQVKLNLPSQVTFPKQQSPHVETSGLSFGKITSTIASDAAAPAIAGSPVAVTTSSTSHQQMTGLLQGHIQEISNFDETKTNILEKTTPYITSRELREGRVPDSERDSYPILAKYVPGDPYERLYVKNLAKQTSIEQLRYIFGRYVDWSDEEEAKTFDIRHMTEGRMKGQAFVTLSNLDAAQAAVAECHSYILNGKPMAVAYAKAKS